MKHSVFVFILTMNKEMGYFYILEDELLYLTNVLPKYLLTMNDNSTPFPTREQKKVIRFNGFFGSSILQMRILHGDVFID